MTKLFNYERSRVLIDHLVNRHHGTHVKQHLDDFITLDGEAFCEICHRYALWNLYLVDYRGSRALETMLGIAAHRNRPAPQRCLALASATLVAGDVQLLAAVASFGTFGLGFRLLFFLAAASASVSLSFLKPCLHFGGIRSGLLRNLASFFLSILACLLLLLLGSLLSLDRSLCLSLRALDLTGFCGNAFFFGTALGIQSFLLFLSLLFQYVALDVRALSTNLDIDGTCSTL